MEFIMKSLLSLIFLFSLTSQAETIYEYTKSDKEATPIALKADVIYPQCKPNAPCHPITKGYRLTVRTVSYGGCNKVDSIFYKANSIFQQDQVMIFYTVQDKNALHIINDEGKKEKLFCHTGQSSVDIEIYLDAKDFYSSKPRLDNIVMRKEINQSKRVQFH